ncbi:MAG: NAD(P)/FAD-dependent oxidoreductase [Ruminococcaceae bacterium]|nr:NAD(P)/FAD-dependent oxidoreductase [Oscillospiraceae bacterium]
MIDKKVAVIGGGPAGMIACGRLKERVKKVYLIEPNMFLGKKLRITGKGRCNITNIADVEEAMQNIPTNSRFLYSALYSFTNDDIISLLNSYGVATKVERGGRVFPESDSAKDVADALKKYALGKNVEWIKDKAVSIITKDGMVSGVKLLKSSLEVDSVIIATGGASYPLTGSTGDGYKMASELGHSIVEPKPSLVPIVTHEKWVADVMGLSLKNVSITMVNEKGKKIYTDFGEMLFTHFGISGPIALSASCHLKKAKSAKIYLDLKPALTLEQLDKRVCRDFEKYVKKHLQNSLDDLLPKNLIPIVIKLSELDPHKEVSSITKEERRRLVNVIKSIELSVKGTRPIDEAIITSGGVKVSEINPSTMESKLVSGLFFAGEVIDVDAYTGGYNLQIAYSTGFLAGENA